MEKPSSKRAASSLLKPDSYSVRPSEKIRLPEIVHYNQEHNTKALRAVNLRKALQRRRGNKPATLGNTEADETRQMLAAWSHQKQRNQLQGPNRKNFIF